MTLDLIERLKMAARWTGVRLSIARGFACWCAYRIIPTHGLWYKVGHAFLPYAGDYCFADDPYVRQSRDHWVRTGRNLKLEGASDGF